MWRKLPGGVEPLYDEVRAAMAGSAYSLAVIGCRKILAHVAIEEGAKQNLKFVDYVDYLADSGYVPAEWERVGGPPSHEGNEANHEIVVISNQDAEG